MFKRSLVIVVMVFSFCQTYSQCNWVEFFYDASGNRVQKAMCQGFVLEDEDPVMEEYEGEEAQMASQMIESEAEPQGMQWSTGVLETKTVAVQVCPNPTTDLAKIQYFKKQGRAEGVLFAPGGAVLQRFSMDEYTHVLSLKDYPDGIYIVWLKTEGGNQVFRIVKD